MYCLRTFSRLPFLRKVILASGQEEHSIPSPQYYTLCSDARRKTTQQRNVSQLQARETDYNGRVPSEPRAPPWSL